MLDNKADSGLRSLEKELWKKRSWIHDGSDLDDLIEATEMLSLRKEMIHKSINFTPELIAEIERANQSLLEIEALMLKRAQQFHTITSNGFEILCALDFQPGDSILNLEIDENNGESYYERMSLLLYKATRSIFCSCCVMSAKLSAKSGVDTFAPLKMDWILPELHKNKDNRDVLSSVPELSHISFCSEFELFYDHSFYSISDIIRLKDFEIQIHEKGINPKTLKGY